MRCVRVSAGIGVLGVLLSLAACGRGFMSFEERDAWRREAELTCLKSGTVREGVSLVKMEPINGPGICGADFPLKVAALGDNGLPPGNGLGFTDNMRPPGAIGGSRVQPNWPVERRSYSTGAASPGVGGDYSPAPPPLPALGPEQPAYQPGSQIAAFGPVALKPQATLACPIVSALDKWILESVQPAAQRWFGQPVVEMRQISAYSCRGMNGQQGANISEHAFGNALDIAAFTLADGRRVVVKDGWRGAPEEQGFLRDVQGAACQQFNTVLAPGSNVYHYDHIHVDLMRRKTGRVICQPAAVSGEEVAARAGYRGPSYANTRRDPFYTGSLGKPKPVASAPSGSKRMALDEEWIEDESRIKYDGR
jgi:hypothetical protein